MIRLIRLQWISRLFQKRNSLAEGAYQFAGGIGAASQVASGNYLVSGASAIGQNRSGNQLNLNSAGLNAISRSMIEINEGRAGVASNLNCLGGGLGGTLGHE